MKKAVVVALVFLLVFVSGAEAAKRFSNYRWDHREVILVENRMGREWNKAVEFSVKSWERAFPRLDFKVIHRPNKKGCGGAPDRIVICKAKKNGSWSGLASIEAYNREIHSVAIWVVNYKPVNEGEKWRGSSTVSLWDMNTLCHELGHAVGLNHNTSSQSCLGNDSLITPGQYDRQSLKMLYKKSGKGWP